MYYIKIDRESKKYIVEGLEIDKLISDAWVCEYPQTIIFFDETSPNNGLHRFSYEIKKCLSLLHDVQCTFEQTNNTLIFNDKTAAQRTCDEWNNQKLQNHREFIWRDRLLDKKWNLRRSLNESVLNCKYC